MPLVYYVYVLQGNVLQIIDLSNIIFQGIFSHLWNNVLSQLQKKQSTKKLNRLASNPYNFNYENENCKKYKTLT